MIIAKRRLMDSIVKGEYSLELFKKDLSCFIDSINKQFDDMIIPALPVIDTPMDLVRKVESMDSLQEEFTNKKELYLLSYSNLAIFFGDEGEYSSFKENEKRFVELSYLSDYYRDSVSIELSDKLTPAFIKYMEKVNTKERNLKIENLYYAVCFVFYRTMLMKRFCQVKAADVSTWSDDERESRARTASLYSITSQKYMDDFTEGQNTSKSAIISILNDYPSETVTALCSQIRSIVTYNECNLRFQKTVRELSTCCRRFVCCNDSCGMIVEAIEGIPQIANYTNSFLLDFLKERCNTNGLKDPVPVEVNDIEEDQFQSEGYSSDSVHISLVPLDMEEDNEDQLAIENTMLCLAEREQTSTPDSKEGDKVLACDGSADYGRGKRIPIVNKKYSKVNTMESFFKQMGDDYDYSINKTKKNKKKVVKKKKNVLKEEDEKVKALKTSVLKESCNGETILRVLEHNDLQSVYLNSQSTSIAYYLIVSNS